MNRNSIRWRLPTSYVVIALLAALSLGSMMLLVLRGYYADQEQEYLFGNATALQPVLAQLIQSDTHDGSLQKQILGLAFLSQTQIRVFDTNGRIVADSGIPNSNQVVAVSGGLSVAGNVMFSMPVNAPDEKGPILIYRSDESLPLPNAIPFEKQSLPGKAADIVVPLSASPYGYGFVARTGSDPGRRSSQSVSVLLMSADGQKLGLLQFSNGPSYGADVINSVTTAWLFASVFAMGIAASTGWFMSRRVTRPVMALEHATHEMEHGDLSVRVDLPNEKQLEFLSLADSFNGMAEQIEQTVSTLRAFVADAAHELHTPLTALQTNLELARGEKSDSQRTYYLAGAQEQGRRLEALVQSLLDLSRIEAAEPKTELVPVDLARLVQERSEAYASRAEQVEREFRLAVEQGPMLVSANESQLGQVVDNLLDNAFKFTPENGTISVSLTRTSDEAQLRVNDNGIGIPSEDLPHVFERFHRARNVSDYHGNGLGLAIVKAILAAHGGQIQVQSESMQGTTFIASLPLHKPED